MKTNHTPGPWIAYENLFGEPIICKDGQQGAIAKVFVLELTKGDPNANARLIAAAPELLEALIRFQDEWVVNGNPAQKANNFSIEQQIYAAIAKATGEKEVSNG